MKALILRIDAPMFSFGKAIVDHHGVTDFFPGLTMLTGLIANALGWQHSDFDKLQNLQRRIDFAARWDVEPHQFVDYHTVDLGTNKMRNLGWTTRGVPEHRRGGDSARYGIHQRYRHYLVDGLMTIALNIEGDAHPGLDEIKEAFLRPARPLFIGRKTCLPARPLLDPNTPVLEGDDLLDILVKVHVWNRDGSPANSPRKTWACWSASLSSDYSGVSNLVYDMREWSSQLPAGSRWRKEGMIGECVHCT